MDTHLPKLDLHGMEKLDVTREIDLFLLGQQNSYSIRIVFGLGRGILERAVTQYLKQLKEKKDGPVLAWKKENSGISCVVLLKK